MDANNSVGSGALRRVSDLLINWRYTMDPSIIAASSSIPAALVSLFGTLFIWRKTAKAAKKASAENRRLSEDLKAIDARQQANIASFQSNLDRMTHVMNANHSKRAEVLTKSYAMLAEIKLLMERFVVPLFKHSVTGDSMTVRDAAIKFEELYKYSSMHAVYFRADSQFVRVLAALMGHINQMQNLAGNNDPSVWNAKARIVIDGVEPLLKKIGSEVRKELGLDL